MEVATKAQLGPKFVDRGILAHPDILKRSEHRGVKKNIVAHRVVANMAVCLPKPSLPPRRSIFANPHADMIVSVLMEGRDTAPEDRLQADGLAQADEPKEIKC